MKNKNKTKKLILLLNKFSKNIKRIEAPTNKLVSKNAKLKKLASTLEEKLKKFEKPLVAVVARGLKHQSTLKKLKEDSESGEESEEEYKNRINEWLHEGYAEKSALEKLFRHIIMLLYKIIPFKKKVVGHALVVIILFFVVLIAAHHFFVRGLTTIFAMFLESPTGQAIDLPSSAVLGIATLFTVIIVAPLFAKVYEAVGATFNNKQGAAKLSLMALGQILKIMFSDKLAENSPSGLGGLFFYPIRAGLEYMFGAEVDKIINKKLNDKEWMDKNGFMILVILNALIATSMAASNKRFLNAATRMSDKSPVDFDNAEFDF